MLLTVLAQTAEPSTTTPTGGGLGSLVIFLPLLALFFFMMRKQGKQRRDHMQLVQNIGVGDEIETVAGMFGIVRRADDQVMWVEMAPGVEMKISRMAVRRKVFEGIEGTSPSDNGS